MTKRIRYDGPVAIFVTTIIPGSNERWRPGQSQEVSDTDAALLLASGKGFADITNVGGVAATINDTLPVTVASGATLTRAAHYNRLVICPGGPLAVNPAGVQPGDALPLQNSSATVPLVVTVGSLVATVPPASNGLLEYNPGTSTNAGWSDAYAAKPVNFSAAYDAGTGRLTGVTLADGTAVVVNYPSATSVVVARTKSGATQTSTYTLDATGTRVIARSVA